MFLYRGTAQLWLWVDQLMFSSVICKQKLFVVFLEDHKRKLMVKKAVDQEKMCVIAVFIGILLDLG